MLITKYPSDYAVVLLVLQYLKKEPGLFHVMRLREDSDDNNDDA
jgi:hypothetical protein